MESVTAITGCPELAPARSRASPAGLITALGRTMVVFDIAIVDWCRCSIVHTNSLAGYLAS
jgi:hypothetical protein